MQGTCPHSLSLYRQRRDSNIGHSDSEPRLLTTSPGRRLFIHIFSNSRAASERVLLALGHTSPHHLTTRCVIPQGGYECPFRSDSRGVTQSQWAALNKTLPPEKNHSQGLTSPISQLKEMGLMGVKDLAKVRCSYEAEVCCEPTI